MSNPKRIGDYVLGRLIIEGKTKQVYDLPSKPGHCVLINKDRITAGDGAKAHDLVGKSKISNETNELVFKLLNQVGIQTAYVERITDTAFISKKCEMIPIEWVTRRLATGSYLRRNPGVKEGFKFYPPKQETFFKDDANHDPQWCDEQIIDANFTFNNVTIGQDEIDIMRKTTILVFEVLEKAWNTKDCVLVDMKIEFGIDENGDILVADVIDSDSWRLWPKGDKRLMVDKQVYRNLTTVTTEDLSKVLKNFDWVRDQLSTIIPPTDDHIVVIIMGSPTDHDFCKKIAQNCDELGLNYDVRISSAHKTPDCTLKIVREYESKWNNIIFIAIAGRSNGLGPVLAGNTTSPVINCPPLKTENFSHDIWSSLNIPSGMGCATVLYPNAAAIHAAQIVATHNYIIWCKLRVNQLNTMISLKKADQVVRAGNKSKK